MVNLSSPPVTDSTPTPTFEPGARIQYRPKNPVKGLHGWAIGTVIGMRSMGLVKVDFRNHGASKPNYWLVRVDDCYPVS